MNRGQFGPNVALLALLAGALLPAGRAEAQPVFVDSIQEPALAPMPAPQIEHRSAGTAFLLSLGTPLLAYAAGGTLAALSDEDSEAALWLAVAGAIAGPSAGHLYTGDYGPAAAYTGGRALSAAVFVAGIGAIIGHGLSNVHCEDRPDCPGDEPGWAAGAMVVGGLGFVTLTLVEPFASIGSARRFNERAEAGGISFSPMVFPAASPDEQGAMPGFMLSAGF